MRVRLSLFGLSVIAASAPGTIGALPAAPVPKHLIAKMPAFVHPTAVGTKWVYDSSGGEQALVITAVETKAKATTITLESVGPNGKTRPDHKLSVSGSEWCMTEEMGHPYEPAWRLVQFPLGSEHKWQLASHRKDLGGTIKGSSTQTAKTERIRVPAGTFEAVKVVSTYAVGKVGWESTTTRWYASGIGLIKLNDPPSSC